MSKNDSNAQQLITAPLRRQLAAFEQRFEAALAEATSSGKAKQLIDETVTFQKYVQQIKAGIEAEKPVAKMVLLAKANYGKVNAPRPVNDRGQGRGGSKSTSVDEGDFAWATLAAFRRMGQHIDELRQWCDEQEDVPTQAGFIKHCAAPHVSQNSEDNEWYTPAEFIEAGRKAMGGIDLDPATSEVANELVRAKRILTAADDSLNQKWTGRVWLNPPYAKNLIGLFIGKLIEEYNADNVKQAVLLVNNATETAWGQAGLAECNAVCFPRGRVKYHRPDGSTGAPLQGQMLLYFGTRVDEFTDEFKEFGTAW